MSYEDDGLGIGYFYHLQDTTAALVTSLRSGDLSVIPQLVEAYIPMARHKAVKFGRTPEFREQIYSEALYQLLLGITKAATQLKDDGLTYYLSAWLNRHILRFLWKQKHTASWDSVNRKGRSNWDMVSHSLNDEDVAFDHRPAEILRENIFALARNAQELDILERLADGETGQDVAESLGLSEATVSRIRTSLEERYNESVSESAKPASAKSKRLHDGGEAVFADEAHLSNF